MNEDILKVEHLSKRFRDTIALDDVSFEIGKGETFSLVGESGSGKTTIGRCIMKLSRASGGKVYFKNRDIFSMKEKDFRPMRREIQMIFQDPYSSLDPLCKVGDLMREAVHEHGIAAGDDEESYVRRIMAECGLRDDMYGKYPDEFSGGERQRIAIARIIALKPELIIADEPVSALDVTVEAEILRLMLDLKRRRQLSYLFISHDMEIVRLISDRIGVMYRGKLVETGSAEEIFSHPLHPYTRMLLSIEEPLPEKLDGGNSIGCPFSSRCPHHKEICREKMPEERNFDGHRILCHLF